MFYGIDGIIFIEFSLMGIENMWLEYGIIIYK